MLVDSHHHLWEFSADQYRWIDESKSVLPIHVADPWRRGLGGVGWAALAGYVRPVLEPFVDRRIIELIEDRTINYAPWITHRSMFDKIVDGFDKYTRPETGVIKAVIDVAV